MGQLELILGGARSGKSTYAEQLAIHRGKQVIYIATAQGLDEEMQNRIVAHQEKRPPGWVTLEIPAHLGRALQERSEWKSSQVVLLDCLTLLISNLVLEVSSNVDEPNEEAATALVQAEIESLKAIIQTSSANWIVVSNEVGMGLVPPYPLGRVYRDLLGWANQQLAMFADEVYFMIAGIPMRLSKVNDQLL